MDTEFFLDDSRYGTNYYNYTELFLHIVLFLGAER